MNSEIPPARYGTASEEGAEWIRVRGLVQGVGLRPTIWRLARELGLKGSVSNDGQGVTIHVGGLRSALETFAAHLQSQAPPLARIEAIEREATDSWPSDEDFQIVASRATAVRTGVVPDAAPCLACIAEIFEPKARRFRYPFSNCTQCGPRLSIIAAIPYDREGTSMRDFALCPECRGEFEDPWDRRFHAQPIACPVCGPRAWLEGADRGDRADPTDVSLESLCSPDALDAACTLLERGHILAIKGVGGFQLACDASHAESVGRLRAWKRRAHKPFALMVRDLEMARAHCRVSDSEAGLLASSAAPIVLLSTTTPARLASAIAPGLTTLGVMLPNSPLHHVLLQRMRVPIILTSGNRSSEPQCIDNEEARERLGGIADAFVMHDRRIERRVDDSVVQLAAGHARTLRRARGYAPEPIRLPDGFEAALPVLALGGELKNAFCLLQHGQAILSHHIGDLEDARCHADFVESVARFRQLFQHNAQAVAVDLHPEYLSRKFGIELAHSEGLPLVQVQHHHAHLAACLFENGRALAAPPVLGIALDGLGYGADGTLWGGEFLRADYRSCVRLASFRPVPLPGGARAMAEPWRNTYAHLTARMGWARFARDYSDLPLYQVLLGKPRSPLDRMIATGLNSPPASSCGRLFDAVAAACGICTHEVDYEGQAAIELEACVDEKALCEEDDALAYPFAIALWPGTGLPSIEPLPMWQALLGDLRQNTPVPVMAARFHKGLAIIITRMTEQLAPHAPHEPNAPHAPHAPHAPQTAAAPAAVALSGGVFQNRILFEQVTARLEARGYEVLTHRRVPANDGGLALGQAAVAAVAAVAALTAVAAVPATGPQPT